MDALGVALKLGPMQPLNAIFLHLDGPGTRDLFARVESAAHQAATSPFGRDQPTVAQLEANRYRTGRVDIQGLPVRIENPRGTRREKPGRWSCLMAHHYGDIAGTRGHDGDPVDVFIGPFPELPVVYVVNQVDRDGEFDEHKVCLGFASEQDARTGYLSCYGPGWDGLGSIVRATVTQLKWWLKFGDKSRPFTPDVLPYEGQPTMDKVFWNPQAEPVTKTLHGLMYELRRDDADAGLMLDAVSLRELMTDPDIEASPLLDAMVVEVGRLQPKMEALQRIMAAASAKVKPTEVSISQPVRYRGVAQVAVVFTMDDGQTVSVWFHNPDTTPAKLMPLDELISWKWMLNKKDVTIVVAPEKGRDLNPREVARRMMRLVERNSEAFKKANAKTAERAAQLQALDTEIAGLEARLDELGRQIEVAKVEAESRPKTPLRAWQSSPGIDPAAGAQVINSWSGEKAESAMRELASSEQNVMKAAKKFASEFLQGRVVKTAIGDCVINAMSVGKLVDSGTRKGSFKLVAIPHVPSILMNGQPGAEEQLRPDSSATVKGTSVYAFVPFTHTFLAGDVKIKASVKVGRRNAAPNLVYSLSKVEAVLDGAENKITPLFAYIQKPSDGMDFAGSQGGDGAIVDNASGFVNTELDGLNIDILQVWDADGNELDPETGELLPPVANKRSPAVERAYAIADVLMSRYGWLKSDENEYPEKGVLVDSPRDSMRWLYLGDEDGRLTWDASKELDKAARDEGWGGRMSAFGEMSDREAAEAIERADFSVDLNVDDDGKIEEGNEFAGKTPAFAYAAEVLRQGAADAGAEVRFGDFSGSTSASLFDRAPPARTLPAETSIYGITAQIGVAGKVLGRASIDEDGKIEILKGDGGTEVVGAPSNPREVLEILSGLLIEQADKHASAEVLYAYNVKEQDGGWIVTFSHPDMASIRIWSPQKEAAIAKAKLAIDLHKNSPFLDRRWNSPVGRVQDVKLVALPTMGPGSELYEITYEGGRSMRVEARYMDGRIEKDEFDATPEGIAAAQEASAKYVREQEALKAAREAAQAEEDRINARIKEFTDAAGYSARDAGKAREVLKARLNYVSFGGVMMRLDFVQKAVADGYTASTEQVNRIKDKTRLQWNRMDQRQQDDHTAKQKAAGQKTEYLLGKDESSFVITKIEYDFANFLANKQVAPTPAPVVPAATGPKGLGTTTATQGTPVQDPQKAADAELPQAMIDGKINLLDETLADKLEPLFIKYENDPEMMDLLNRAANAYGDAAVAAAKKALGI